MSELQRLVDVDEVLHKGALERTAQVLSSTPLRDVLALARSMELPTEIVLSLYKQHVHDLQREAESTRARIRQAAQDAMLDLNTDIPPPSSCPSPVRVEMLFRALSEDRKLAAIPPGEHYEVVASAHCSTFQLSELHIAQHPEAWRLQSLKIGNREQLHLPYDRRGRSRIRIVYGHTFNALVAKKELEIEVAQLFMHVVMVVENTSKETLTFDAKLIGTGTYWP
jgi:hypothetical protein